VKVCGLIVARGGSKSIPRKNIAPLCGRPLLLYTVDAALAAKTLDRVIISTDSEEIAAIAREAGVEVPFMRPPELAQDDTRHFEVIEHAALWLRDNWPEYGIIVGLQPTSPFRGAHIIDEAVEKLRRLNADAVFTVREADTGPEKMLVIDEDCVRPPGGICHAHVENDGGHRTCYMKNGACEVYRRDLVIEQKRLYGSGDNVAVVVMSKLESLDIDDPLDLVIAEAVMAQRGRLEER
jgi:CMP-N,N'-diacetyllegionaminic acid synthase